jgi:CheY-like chemotaxis protein
MHIGTPLESEGLEE